MFAFKNESGDKLIKKYHRSIDIIIFAFKESCKLQKLYIK